MTDDGTSTFEIPCAQMRRQRRDTATTTRVDSLVLPAASNPSMRMRISLLPKILPVCGRIREVPMSKSRRGLASNEDQQLERERETRPGVVLCAVCGHANAPSAFDRLEPLKTNPAEEAKCQQQRRGSDATCRMIGMQTYMMGRAKLEGSGRGKEARRGTGRRETRRERSKAAKV